VASFKEKRCQGPALVDDFPSHLPRLYILHHGIGMLLVTVRYAPYSVFFFFEEDNLT